MIQSLLFMNRVREIFLKCWKPSFWKFVVKIFELGQYTDFEVFIFLYEFKIDVCGYKHQFNHELSYVASPPFESKTYMCSLSLAIKYVFKVPQLIKYSY